MMAGFKILIVEDAIDSARELRKLFAGEFPTSRIDCAASRREATALLAKLEKQGEFYNLAIVDLELPEDLSGPVQDYQTYFDEAFIDYFWDRRESMFTFLMTAHSEDNPQVKSYFAAMDRLKDPRFRKYPKLAGYTYDMLRDSLSCIYGGKILALIGGMLGDDRQAIPMLSGLTTRLAEIQAEIQLRWKDLHEDIRNRVRARIDVDDLVDPPKIRLK
jgi:CheY-like chemotaxis protein